jgi:hypothetical protein
MHYCMLLLVDQLNMLLVMFYVAKLDPQELDLLV